MNRLKIFISSVQSEFAEERAMLSHYIRTDVLLGKFFEPFIFEEIPAVNQSPEQVYLGEVERCDLYLGLIGCKYGYEDAEGVSPTEREYDLADKLGKYKLIFINSTTEQTRHPKEAAFVSKIERSVVRKTFSNMESLRAAVYAALVRYMEEKEMSRVNNWVGVRNSMETASVATHPEFPIEAVQEAIVNAVCHRDYTSNASVQVMLFRNRLEVWNPGQLPHELTIEDLYKPHRSSPPNILLAEPMYWNGYIEKVGSGTEDLVERCVNYGLKKPEFVQDANFQVTLWRNELAEENMGKEGREKSAQIGGQNDFQDEKSSEKSSEKIIRLLKQDPSFTIAELAETLSMSTRGVEKNIKKLQSIGVLSRIGPDKGGYWQVNRENYKAID